MKKRLIALALVLVLVLGCLAACGNKSEEPKTDGSETKQPDNTQKEPEKEPEEPAGNNKPATTSKEENALRVRIYPSYETFDPNHVDGGAELQIYPSFYETLFFMDGRGGYSPMLAKSYELNDDGSVTFELRDDVYFHNGEHMTADDVVYSHDRTELSMQVNYVYDYTVFEKIDDYHVKVSSVDPEAVPITDIAPYIFRMAIMCKSFCEAIGDDPKTDTQFQVNGTGPYKLEKIDPTTHDVTITKFDKYWGTPAYIDTVYFRAITGDAEMAFESGELDYQRYTPTNLPLILEYDNVYLHEEFSGEQWYLVNNCGKAPMNDMNVRKAMILALDREEIGDVATDGGGTTSWNLVTVNLPGYFDVTEHLDNDVEEARRLMSEAGYSDANRAKVVYVSIGESPIGPVLKERLEQAYFEVEIVSAMDLTRIWAGDFDIMSITLQLDGINEYALLFNDGFNLAQDFNYELADEISNAHDDEAYKQMQIDMFNEYAYVPLSMPTSFYVFDKDLEIVEGEYLTFTAIDFMFRSLRWKD